tara:strand:- start:4121 stop:4414 length:294 start_codon:yes stop_codon:yes gene_type:complete
MTKISDLEKRVAKLEKDIASLMKDDTVTLETKGTSAKTKKSTKGKSTQGKTKKKRKINKYFQMMLAAKKAGEPSFVYNGNTYKGTKHPRLGMIYKKA